MKANSKKLLSWLLVAAMVLSMVPVLDLSNFAVETNAAEQATVVYGEENLDAAPKFADGKTVSEKIADAKEIQDANLAELIGQSKCPICGDNVTWVSHTQAIAAYVEKNGDNKAAQFDIGVAATDEKYHIYFDGDADDDGVADAAITSTAYNFAQTKADGQTICIALVNNPTLDLDGYIRNSNAGCTINIMGEGTIQSDGKKADGTTDASDAMGLLLMQGGSSTLNLYGGTYVCTGDCDYKKDDGYARYAALTVKGRTEGNVCNIYDGVTIGPEMIDGDVEGEKVVDNSKGVYNVRVENGTLNMFGGTIQNGVAGEAAYIDDNFLAEHTDMTAYKNSYYAPGNLFVVTANATANIYGGQIINGTFRTYMDGEEEKWAASWGGNVVVTGTANLNMYGGEIANGSAGNGGNAGGNLLAHGTVNLLGGTISGGKAPHSAGGNIFAAKGSLTIGGTVLIENGEAATKGGNIYITGSTANVTINGGKILNGVVGSTNGGDYYDRVVAMKEAVEAEGATTAQTYEAGSAGYGGNIAVAGGAKLTIEDGLIEGGTAYAYAKATATYSSNKWTMKTATLTGGGGSIYLNASELDFKKGTITGGTTEAGGGNISLESDAKLTVRAEATVQNGTATCHRKDGMGGGNIYASTNCAEAINIYGKVLSGKTTGYQGNGGNISIAGGVTLNVYDGAEIANGWIEQNGSSGWGANIRCWKGTVNVLGGLIYGGVTGPNKDVAVGTLNIGCQGEGSSLTIGGNAVIVGDVLTATSTAELILKGSPKIVTAYQLEDGTVATASTGGLTMVAARPANIAELTDEAIICVTTSATVLTEARTDAEEVARCFYVNKTLKGVSKNTETNQLEIDDEVAWKTPADYTEAADKIWAAARISCMDPDMVMAGTTCPMCGATSVTWTETGAPGEKKATTTNGQTYHYALGTEEVNDGYNWAALNNENQTMCLLMVGNPTLDIGGLIGFRNNAANGTMNIMGAGTVTSDSVYYSSATNPNASADNLGTILVQGAGNTLNLYNGTYTYTGANVKSTATTTLNSAVLNIKSATSVSKDASDAAYTETYTAPNVCNIFDGVTIGNAQQDLDTANYNVFVQKGTLNMYGGTIQNGVSALTAAGGNVTMDKSNSTFNMYGGVIKNGYALGRGGNISASAGSMTIGGDALIDNGRVQGWETVVTDADAGTTAIYGVGTGGGNIYSAATLTIQDNAVISNGEILNGKTEETTYLKSNGGKPALGGGNIHSAGNFLMTGGTVKDGTVNLTSVGGGNIYASSGKTVQIQGGTVSEGNSTQSNGGNIYVYNGKLEISGKAVIDHGTAAKSGGNIYKYGTDAGYGNTTTHYVTIGGEAKVTNGVAETEAGGNIHLTASKLTLGGTAEISGGIAATAGGNVYIAGANIKTSSDATEKVDHYAVFQITGGTIKDGTINNMKSANVYAYKANVEMSGGLISGTKDANAAGSSVRISTGATLYLSGDASIVRQDGVKYNSVQLEGDEGAIRINKNWTGTATAAFNTNPFNPGDVIKIDGYDNGLVGTWTATTDETTGLVTYTFTKDETAEGTYSGTLTLEKAPYLNILGVNGDMYLAAASVTAADGTTTWKASNADALAAYAAAENPKYVTLLGGEATLNGDVYLNLAGSTGLVLSGNGEVSGIDTENDDYEGFGSFTIADGATVTVADEAEITEGGVTKRYVKLYDTETKAYSFHRFELKLKTVSLRAGEKDSDNNVLVATNPGVYYKAVFSCDDTLKSAVNNGGVGLTTDADTKLNADYMLTPDMPVTNITAAKMKGTDEKYTYTFNSGLLNNIMKEVNGGSANATNADMTVFANIYMVVNNGTGGVCLLGNNTGADYTGYSLLDILGLVNDKWTAYADPADSTQLSAQQDLIRRAVTEWMSWVDSSAENYSKWQALTNILGE